VETDSIQLEPSGNDGLKLKLGASLQLATMEEFHRMAMVINDSAKNLAVNCSAADYLDSLSLQILCLLKKSRQSCGKELKWTGVSAELRNWLSLAGLESLVEDSGA